ncbi:M56 family metallopeptidase [Rhodanobacter denitrificans]|uniref:M56 family metallopeptidase n=1 Tax=Rhodanobacter denitrificans TaxID=666685 RepID=UPI00026102AB|nr:M56 family metallopeptidase [Rhodanobacter denitrificans]EIM04699.1 TonB family protein [Rhodanobacter denitrificans]UJJ59278.1 M56 family metallopeptidase [Rhodanobacter denitrificans]UJM89742.1 M56 family metallopeptidase [Rhodanobacter denitrificans]
MSSVELTGTDWLGRGWLLILAFTAAALLAAALRRPCRRLFGAERAFQLWLLPPLALLASQLPHATAAPAVMLSPVVVAITSAATALPVYAAGPSATDWRVWTMLLWLLGSMASLLQAVLAQARYRMRLRGATSVVDAQSRWPVLRAPGADVGPALIGAWHARIVLPADFEQRYDAGERALILAHETAHARRGDGWWCLLARVLAALFWFHPLAWWALAALRHDQELACDAAVLREHGAQRRSYANAMLKTQSAAFALPVGCTWSPRHPLTERIAMLKLPSPNRWRRNTGMIAGIAVAIVVAGSVYAASAPQGERPAWKVQADHATWKVRGQEYQLDMQVELSTDAGHERHAENVALALCMAPGKAAMASVGTLRVEATTVPAGDRQVRIDLAVGNTGESPLAHSQLLGVLGHKLRAAGTRGDGKHAYVIDVTPQAGCPARAVAEASPVKVTGHVTNSTARAVAESIAAKAGWTLANPEALGHAPVTLSFNDMPAGTAMQRVADLAGMKLVLDGERVRFTPR